MTVRLSGSMARGALQVIRPFGKDFVPSQGFGVYWHREFMFALQKYVYVHNEIGSCFLTCKILNRMNRGD